VPSRAEIYPPHPRQRQPQDDGRGAGPKTKTLTAGLDPIWDGGSEPDVPWGKGGIDDWGWRDEAAISSHDSHSGSSAITNPKELIPHV
jgi:hypothetical protein